MPATVISGVFSSWNITWTNNTEAAPSIGVFLVSNPLFIPLTLNSGAFTGPDAAQFSLPAGQFPVTLQPNQSAVIQARFTGGTSIPPHVYTATLTISTNVGAFSPVQLMIGNDVGVGALYGCSVFPDVQIVFPTTKVGQTVNLTQLFIGNNSVNTIRVTNISVTTGTDFFVTGAPITPFNIVWPGSSAVFNIQFTPTTAGNRSDNLNVTIDDGAGGHISTVSVNLQGIGSTLQSAFNLTGGTTGVLFAVPGSGVPSILLANPTNFDCEEPCSAVKLHDFGIVNNEKRLMRIRGHYEDLGAATITFKARSRRLGKPDDTILVNVPIGTGFADGWIREFTSEPTPITGELIQLTVSRAGSSGQVSLIDYMPQFEPMGEVIGGT